MEDLIFIAQRIPYPPNKGDKLRSWNALQRLAERYRIHLGSFIDDPADWQYEKVISELCESHLLLPLNKFAGKVRSIRAFVTGEALTIPYFRDMRMVRWLEEVWDKYQPTKAFTFSSGVAGYVMGPMWEKLRRVHDMADVDSGKWQQYAERKSGIQRWIYKREGKKLLDFERRIAAEYDATLFVSEYETALFRRLSPETAAKVHTIRNGVDSEFFDPNLNYENSYPEGIEPVVLTGTMDYWPNVDAAKWFVANVFREMHEIRKQAVFYVVGANPTPEVLALNDVEGVRVTGRVPDIRPYIAHAQVIVAPLQIARGVQNKVLEGMAMEKPVIASPMAFEGIQAESGRDLILAETPEQFLEAIIRVLDKGTDQIGKQARKRILSDYSWDKNLEYLFEYLEA